MLFTADDLTANLVIWIALRCTHPNKPPVSPSKDPPAFTCPTKCPEVQTDLLTPCLGNIPPPDSSFLPTNRAGPSGHPLKRAERGAVNGACLVRQCQTKPANGAANPAAGRGAASSFPAPSPPPFKPLCSPLQNRWAPEATANRWTKSPGAVLQKGRALAGNAYDCRISPSLHHLLWVPLKTVTRTKAKQKIRVRELLLHLGEGKSTRVTPGWATGPHFWSFLRRKTSAALMKCGVQTWL